MTDYILRGFSDGTDFFRPVSTRSNIHMISPRGFGDMICTLSNLLAEPDSTSRLLLPYINAGYLEWSRLCNITEKLERLDVNLPLYNRYVSMSYDNVSLANASGLQVLDNYPKSEYIQIDKRRLSEYSIPKHKYITYQYSGHSKRCGYTNKIIDDILSTYSGYEYVDVGGKEGLGLSKIGYAIEHADIHVGIDSGMTHFAYCIKKPKDVHVYIPSDKQTGVAKRWIKMGFDVRLI